ncbi:hypothetical protein E4U57_007523 [Claviceps arundinis]|uniref:Uncharacterized protein n=1 Tax=Claviceps arundinis TaxID=1623583 RepID=A0A9P7SME2_9HYPO|nr:hypothetical protein E4U57_007523 [Claviceps arundinis]KAG5962685.1 hypothetical protein E4U56_003255 [Claviceps arundinis]
MEIFWSLSDFQATATARAIANFRYLHEHELIICRYHGYAIGGLDRHLSQYHDYSLSVRTAVSRHFDGLSQAVPENASLPKPYGPPIEGLAPPRKGFACAKADCVWVSTRREGIMKHCRTHGWKSTPGDREPWIQVWVQTFSLTPGKQRWFIVSVGEGQTTAGLAPISGRSGPTTLRTRRRRSKRRGAQSEDDQSDDGQQRPPRKAPRKANESRERHTTHGEDEFLREGLSIKELARPYLLTITKLPIKALDITGRNRPLDADHVTDLKNVFRRHGLERMASENRLLCLCTAADVQFGDTAWSDEQSKDIRHWSEAISSPIEVLAGQHRIAALREYVTEIESDPAELWWTCELYDRDTLPMHLNQRMRYNRTDPAMPDSHAQVWMQLVDIISRQQDEKVSDSDAVNSDQDPLEKVGVPVLDVLRLGNSEIKFPQLVTLWNNRPWRRVITQWCRTRLGTDSFAFSSMNWIASLRIDEYYLGLMESALNTLRSLPLDTATHISPSDWDQLAAAFGTRGGDQTSDALSIFYDASGGTRMRNRGLLTSLGDAEYDAFYQHMMKADQLDFLSPHRITRSQIQIMTQVLHHVIAWIDPEMIAILLQQSHGPQSKPLIRTYLQDALRNLARSKGFSNFAVSDKQAVHMQKTILDFAREQTTKFDSCPIRLTFFKVDSAPYLTTSDYATRFAYGVWTRLLDLTRDQLAIAIGSPALTFHQEWDNVVVPTVISAEATSLPTPTLVELPYLLTRIVANARDQGCFEGVAGSTARTKIIHTLQEAIDDLQKDVSSQGSSEGLKPTTAAKSTALPLREFPIRMRPEDKRRITARAVDNRTTSTPMEKALPSSTRADTVETETDLIAWYIGGL